MRSAAIIGAGVTGLTAAFYLKRKGVPVTVYEASDRVGGAIQSIRAEGYLAEFGPNTILETSPKVTQLVCDAGLASRRLDTDSYAETPDSIISPSPCNIAAPVDGGTPPVPSPVISEGLRNWHFSPSSRAYRLEAQ
jgi:protoporphyrinogen oxidase